MKPVSLEPAGLLRAGRSSSLPAPAQGRRAALVAAVLLVGSCASYQAMPLDGVDLLEQLAERAVLQTEFTGPSRWSEQWFPFASEVQCVDGLTLAEANALALFYSPAIRTARARENVSEALVLQAGVLQNPQLNGGPLISTEGADGIFPASLYWQLPLWGQVEARRENARANLSVSELAVLEAELSTLQAVRAAFLALERRRREEATYAAAAEISSELVQWVKSLGTAGQANAATLFLVAAERDAVLAALEQARAAHAVARSELFELLGLLPGADVEVLTEDAYALPLAPEVSDAESALRVPALRSASAAYEAAEAALKLAVRSQYPSLRLGLEYEDDRGEVLLGPGLSLSLPIFNRNQGGIAAAQQTRGIARERYTAELLRVLHSTARARATAEGTERVLETYRAGALRDAQNALLALGKRLRLGRATALEAVTTQSALARTRVRLLELEEQLSLARLELAVASGAALSTAEEPGSKDANQ